MTEHFHFAPAAVALARRSRWLRAGLFLMLLLAAMIAAQPGTVAVSSGPEAWPAATGNLLIVGDRAFRILPDATWPETGPVCGTASWVNPTDPIGVITVNLWKGSQKKILDTPLGRMDFGGGVTSYAFCTDIYHPRPYLRAYCLDSGFFSDWRVTWLVANYPPVLTDAAQQAARQAAVWYFTDGFSLDQADPTLYNADWDAAVRNAYNAIMAAIPASPPPEYQPGNLQLVIDPATGANFLPGEEVHAFTVRLTKGGYPLAGYAVNLASSIGALSATSGVTDAAGEAHFTVTSQTPGTATITASAAVTVPAGSRFIDQTNPDGEQRLVLGGQVQVTAQAQATKTWVQSANLILAHKFEDVNHNRVQEDGEPNLAGWQFVLTVATGGLPGQYSATSDSHGNAYFYDKVTGNGAYTLTEVMQTGWSNTTPSSQGRIRTDADPWSRWQADFGNAQNSIIQVFKFLDRDGNGQWDAGEPPLSGWQFALYIRSSGDWIQHRGGTTDPAGWVIFTGLATGEYKVVERLADRPGYINTTPVEQVVSLGFPASETVRFGNRGSLSLSGAKWYDQDADGIRDAGEPGLAGWTITLGGGPHDTATSGVTDGTGGYAFGNLEPGTYTVAEVRQAGWVQTAPAGGSYTVTLVGQSATGLDFGNVGAATIGDRVWNDINANGSQDPGEPGINGACVLLFTDPNCDGNAADGALAATQTTGPAPITGDAGWYRFSDLRPGCYSVQVDQPGSGAALLGFTFIAGAGSGPLPHAIFASAGDNYALADFGYAGRGTISGTVFYDWNRNGHQDPSETPISGVRACLYRDVNGDSHLDLGDTLMGPCADTDSLGNYAFPNLLPGRYIVAEDQPPGLDSTTPSVRVVDLIVVGPIGTAPDNDFGELLYVRLGDFTYIDANGNGQQDAGETTGLSDVTVEVVGVDLSGATVHRTATTVNGAYLVEGLLPGTYTVTAPIFVRQYAVTSPYRRIVTLTPGLTVDLTVDFGYQVYYPTGVAIQHFEATVGDAGVALRWQAASAAAAGCQLWRSESAKGYDPLLLTPTPLAADPDGWFHFTDQVVKRGRSYWYWLADPADGQRYGPWRVTAGRPVRLFLPMTLK